jgi:hypothetical protein
LYKRGLEANKRFLVGYPRQQEVVHKALRLTLGKALELNAAAYERWQRLLGNPLPGAAPGMPPPQQLPPPPQPPSVKK